LKNNKDRRYIYVTCAEHRKHAHVSDTSALRCYAAFRANKRYSPVAVHPTEKNIYTENQNIALNNWGSWLPWMHLKTLFSRCRVPDRKNYSHGKQKKKKKMPSSNWGTLPSVDAPKNVIPPLPSTQPKNIFTRKTKKLPYSSWGTLLSVDAP